MLSNDAIIAIVTTVQFLTTAWTHRQVTKNACGGAKCLEAIKQASVPKPEVKL